jgi:hypothetical protein
MSNSKAVGVDPVTHSITLEKIPTSEDDIMFSSPASIDKRIGIVTAKLMLSETAAKIVVITNVAWRSLSLPEKYN